eukprot:2946902-Pleurochrysis_carterae.AAC.1
MMGITGTWHGELTTDMKICLEFKRQHVALSKCITFMPAAQHSANIYATNLCPTSKRRIVFFVAGESGDRMAPLTPHSPSIR